LFFGIAVVCGFKVVVVCIPVSRLSTYNLRSWTGCLHQSRWEHFWRTRSDERKRIQHDKLHIYFTTFPWSVRVCVSLFPSFGCFRLLPLLVPKVCVYLSVSGAVSLIHFLFQFSSIQFTLMS